MMTFPINIMENKFHGSSHHQPDILIIDYHYQPLLSTINHY